MVKQNLKANIDERLDERRTGIPNDDKVKDWYTRQYLDENYKTIGGESKKDVENRMFMDDVVYQCNCICSRHFF